ncbi:MipA/OmpV family protein [Szabonella alba]|uniref:MipA/OmpV family protein n=1 Tax=Szabonella alba TaxID=2804194 RepID=A0A8K0VC46_9RHOB|nr:MipA/OmpV family protein [Szabonella alba]MBL4917518.1 MipA/OmpV family protein [Szabonella alba]
MTHPRLAAAALALSVLAAPLAPAFAGSLETTAQDQAVYTPPPAPAPRPGLAFKLRGGVGAAPEYFGSRDLKAGPDFALSFEFLRLPGGMTLGNPDPASPRYGFAPRGSFRYIAKRSANDHSELAGLDDVKASVELGLGLGYTQRNFEAYADLRYGVIGHNAWVGELGANLVLRPSDRLTLRAGPRVFMGDSRYANTYFGVTPAEASVALPAFSASGGALSAGIEIGATYAINDLWGIDGAIRYDRYLNDAKDSPIVQQGRDDAVSLRLGLTRRISLGF